jgi:hypothetical protein
MREARAELLATIIAPFGALRCRGGLRPKFFDWKESGKHRDEAARIDTRLQVLKTSQSGCAAIKVAAAQFSMPHLPVELAGAVLSGLLRAGHVGTSQLFGI